MQCRGADFCFCLALQLRTDLSCERGGKADALGSGPSGHSPVWVQIPPLAPLLEAPVEGASIF